MYGAPRARGSGSDSGNHGAPRNVLLALGNKACRAGARHADKTAVTLRVEVLDYFTVGELGESGAWPGEVPSGASGFVELGEVDGGAREPSRASVTSLRTSGSAAAATSKNAALI